MRLDYTWRRLDWFLLTAILVLMMFTTQSFALHEADVEAMETDEQLIVYVVVTDERQPETTASVEPVVEEEPEPLYSDEEIRMIAKMTYAEAGNQSELGKRLVIDVILNRVEHEGPQFPDTVEGVLFQKNQFSPASNGAYERAEVLEDIVRLVKEEIERRTDPDIAFFRASHYGEYGIPMYQVGGHYFSSFA